MVVGRQSGAKPARRWRVYRILLPTAAATAPILLIIVIIAIALAVNH